MTFPRLNTKRFYGLAWPKAVIPISDIRMSIYQSPESVVSEIRHPLYIKDEQNWAKWQMVYDAGDEFIEEFVVKFSRREGAKDFARRKSVTPVAAFATSSVNEIKNSTKVICGILCRSPWWCRSQGSQYDLVHRHSDFA
jgi:hypothetical protein